MVSRPTRKSASKVGSYKEPTISDIPMADEDDNEEESNHDPSSTSQHDDDNDDDDDSSINDSSVVIQSPKSGKRKRDETSQDWKESDAENDDSKHNDSEEDMVQDTVTKRRKRGRPKGSTGRKKGEARGRDYGPLKDRTCPNCGKVFKIMFGLAYHIEHNVCSKVKVNDIIGTVPMPKLQPGDCFVTDLGVVKVVKDERVGDDFGKTLVSSDIKNQNNLYNRQRERIRARRNKMCLYHAKLSRKRRQNIHNLYLKRKDGSISEKDFANEIFDTYIPGLPVNQALAGLFQMEPNNLVPTPAFPKDPMQPPDSYPERIVECVLIKDERKRITDLDEELNESGRLSQVDVASAIVAKAQKMKKHENSSEASGLNEIHESGMKVYIRRNLLTVSYSKHLPVYTCADCGKSFGTRAGCKSHRDDKTCLEQLKNSKDAREKRLEEIEESLLMKKTELAIQAPRFVQENKTKKKDTRKRGRKKSKVYPSWLVFYADKSSLYPEVFESLKCKRGSNNSKFVKKIWDALGPGRKKRRKSRARGSMNHNVKSEDDDDDDDDDSKSFTYSVGGSSISSKPRKSRGAAQKANAKMAQYQDKDSDDDSNKGTDDEFHIEEDGDDYDEDSVGVAFESTELPPLPRVPTLSLPQDAHPMPSLPVPMPSLPVTGDSSQMSPPVQTKSSSTKKTDSSVASSSADESSTRKSWIEPPKKKSKNRPPSNPTNVVSDSSNALVIDIRPLMEEVRAGRYPSMKAYTGEHLDICFICKTEDKEVYHCEFCCNSEHLVCIQSKLTIHNLEPDDEFMCHRCIQTCMSRRNRAERRRQEKLNKASSSTAANSEPKPQIVWNQTNDEIDAYISTYSKCPNGGSGGLTCCKHCSNAYSRLLAETSKEMEVQTVSSLGREVSELIELLNDAQARLKQVVDVTNLNDVRRSLLNKSEIGNHSSNNGTQGI